YGNVIQDQGSKMRVPPIHSRLAIARNKTFHPFAVDYHVARIVTQHAPELKTDRANVPICGHAVRSPAPWISEAVPVGKPLPHGASKLVEIALGSAVIGGDLFPGKRQLLPLVLCKKERRQN